jgi:serine/threonine-protein kinase
MTERPDSQQQPSSKEPWPDGVPHAGEVIGGKYVCEGILGTGGMGVVLSARHRQLGQQVAIKVLLPDALKDPVATERFLREARAAISIRSDHVARVMDFGTLESGAPYLVMEHLDGNDLKEQLALRAPLPVELVVDYVIQACEALCEAHRRGIVHRDLKPANLFLSSRMDGSPHVRVLDFGISKTVSLAAAATGAGDGITRTDAVFGTPAYMSPEQLRSSKLVDHRTDIWSLGVVLYELIAGKLPFGSTSDGIVSMCAHILEDPPPSLRALRPETSTGLESAILRCLSKHPSDRFQNIADLTAALVAFASSASGEAAGRIARMSDDSLPFSATVKSDSGPLSGQGAANTSSAWGKTGSTTRRRSMTRMAMMGAAMLVFGFAIGGAWFMGNRSGSHRGSVEPATHGPPTLSATSNPEPVATPDASALQTATSPAASVSADAASAPAVSPRVPPTVAVTRTDPAKSAPAPTPTCAPGMTMSNGHCCPTGFEWKGGDCVPGVARK